MGDPRFAVVASPISAHALNSLVNAPGFGALCAFEGIVRDHTGDAPTSHLEYEAYAAMAERVFAQIAEAAAERWEGTVVAIHHRVGRLEIGEVSVAIVAAAAHRAEAFEACRFAIERLKASAPIWKKEFGPDGDHWVEGPAAESIEPPGGAGAEGTGAAAEPRSNRAGG